MGVGVETDIRAERWVRSNAHKEPGGCTGTQKDMNTFTHTRTHAERQTKGRVDVQRNAHRCTGKERQKCIKKWLEMGR